ncbi:GTPase domain-containing protein [Enterobacter sp. JGM127]|nr:GTPase domain-containing protein [Enterobacter sp. JGM127]
MFEGLALVSPVLKTASAVFTTRKMILSAICSCISKAMSSKVIVTGMAGAGKSYLFEAIVQESKNKKMNRPGQSVQGEDHILYLGNGLLPKKITIIPGQNMAVSSDLKNKKIDKNDDLDGVIHVMDFGYNSPRDQYSKDNFESKGIFTFEDLRQYNLNAELDYLEGLIERFIILNKRPKWFCLVLTKTDLYKSSTAARYYKENPRFQQIIEKLYKVVDRDHIALFIPTCSDISSLSYGRRNINPKYVKNNGDSLKLLISLMLTIEMIDY